MIKRIAIDDVTYVTLKKLAEADGRSLVGELRFILREYAGREESHASVGNGFGPQMMTTKLQHSSNKDKGAGEITELQQMVNRLKYFEEGSPEYEEALERIIELQKED